MSLLFIVQFSVGLAAVATPQTRQKDLLAKGKLHPAAVVSKGFQALKTFSSTEMYILVVYHPAHSACVFSHT
jgi:hypothetical protein